MSAYPPRFLASELPLLEPGVCRFHIIPVPYEATVSYGGGTALGPRAIIEASQQLEVWTGRNIPSERGIHTWPEVDCAGGPEVVLSRIRAAVENALSCAGGPPVQALRQARGPQSSENGRVIPIVLGGEHSVSLGAFRALQARYGSFGIVHFDAHADLRDTYEGSPHSHACVMRRAVADLGLSLFQIGVRSLSPEEVAFRQASSIRHLDAGEAIFPLWHANSPGLTGLRPFPLPLLPDDFPGLIYISFDVDAFDASLMPATGTPEPGGLFWWDALRLIGASLAGRACIGFDVVELAPIPGMHAPNYTTARLVHEIMGLLAA